MNALPVWDDELRLDAAPAQDDDPAQIPSTPSAIDNLFASLPHDPRRAALVRAIGAVDPESGVADAVLQMLAAIDRADADAGITRVDTGDVVLQQRIARIVAGTNLPSRGPATRAREILSLLRTHRPA